MLNIYFYNEDSHMDKTIKEWIQLSSELLTFNVVDQSTHPFPLQSEKKKKAYVYGGEDSELFFVNPFEIMLWISTKPPEILLLSYRRDMKNILSEIVRNDICVDIVELFLMRGVDPNTCLYGYPLFFTASPQNLIRMLEYGANPNFRLKNRVDIAHFLLRSIDDYTLTKIEILITHGLSLYYEYNRETSYDKIEKIYGRHVMENRIIPIMKQYFLLGKTNGSLFNSQPSDIFLKIIKNEELYMEYRKGILCKLIHYNPVIDDDFKRRILLNNYKYAILAYFKNPNQLKAFCEWFIQKRKLH